MRHLIISIFCFLPFLAYSQEVRYDSLQNINPNNYTQLVGQTLFYPSGEIVVSNLFWSNKKGKIYKPRDVLAGLLMSNYSLNDAVLNKHFIVEKVISGTQPLLKTRIKENNEVVFINLNSLFKSTQYPVMFVDGYIQKCKERFLHHALYMDKSKHSISLPSSCFIANTTIASIFCSSINVTTKQNYGGILFLSDRTSPSTPADINVTDYIKAEISENEADESISLAKSQSEHEEIARKQKQHLADSIAQIYEIYEDPEWKSKAKTEQHYSKVLYDSDFPYVSFRDYNSSTRFLVRCNKASNDYSYRISVKVQGGGRTTIKDLNNCFVRFKSFRPESYNFSSVEHVKPLLTFETDDGTTLTFECKSESDCIRLPYLFKVDDIETARIVLIGVKIWGTRDSKFPYTPLTIIGVGIGNSAKYQHNIMVIDNQGQKHSILTNLSLTNALILEDEDNHFIEQYKFSDPEKAFPRIPKSDWNLIRQGRIRIGMSKDACKLSWGEPDDINTSRGRWGVHEQWVYSRNRYVYFENGKLSAIQE